MRAKYQTAKGASTATRQIASLTPLFHFDDEFGVTQRSPITNRLFGAIQFRLQLQQSNQLIDIDRFWHAIGNLPHSLL